MSCAPSLPNASAAPSETRSPSPRAAEATVPASWGATIAATRSTFAVPYESDTGGVSQPSGGDSRGTGAVDRRGRPGEWGPFPVTDYDTPADDGGTQADCHRLHPAARPVDAARPAVPARRPAAVGEPGRAGWEERCQSLWAVPARQALPHATGPDGPSSANTLAGTMTLVEPLLARFEWGQGETSRHREVRPAVRSATLCGVGRLGQRRQVLSMRVPPEAATSHSRCRSTPDRASSEG